MSDLTPPTPLEFLVQQLLAAAVHPPEDAPPPEEISMRHRFMELLVLSLSSLYGKTPIPGSPFDRAMLKRVTEGLDDNDAGRFSTRTDDWLRLEGLVRVQEGQKNYSLNRMSLAVLSQPTSQGTLGEVMEAIAAIYAASPPTPQVRQITRQFGAYFMTRLGRGA